MSNSSWRDKTQGPFTADTMKPDGYYELSNGHPVELAPARQNHGGANLLGAAVVGLDPLVRLSGVDVGHKLAEGTLRAPDVSVGGVVGPGGWVEGAPPLAIEYAGEGTVERELQGKVAELLAAGSQQVWVVRLVGPRRVEVYEPGKPVRTAVDRDELSVPGVLQNPVPAAALYDRDAALVASLRNGLQHFGYQSLDEVRLEGEAAGEERGRAEGRVEGEAAHAVASVLRVLEARGLAVTPEQRARIASERTLAVLDRWLTRAVTARDAGALFVEEAL